MKGIVKWFNDAKGYGFILSTEENGGKEYFVHRSSIVEKNCSRLFEADKVTFTSAKDKQGRLQATCVSKLTEEKAEKKVEENEASTEEIKQTIKEI